MSELHARHRLVKELRELGDDPEYHPMHRALFKDAADAIETMARDLDDLHRLGDDHT